MKLLEQGYGLSPIFTQVERRTDMLSEADTAESHRLVAPTGALCCSTVLGTGVQDPGASRVEISLKELGQTCLSLHWVLSTGQSSVQPMHASFYLLPPKDTNHPGSNSHCTPECCLKELHLQRPY